VSSLFRCFESVGVHGILFYKFTEIIVQDRAVVFFFYFKVRHPVMLLIIDAYSLSPPPPQEYKDKEIQGNNFASLFVRV
jgi:hypothetical protein